MSSHVAATARSSLILRMAAAAAAAAAPAASSDVPPNQTIYIQNLNEKIKKEELRKSLYALFSQFGPILDVVALKTDRMRGQAFIVFKEISSATNALRQMNNFTFFDKQMRIQYARSKSDVVAKLDGTWVERKKEPKPSAPKRRPDAQEKKPAVKKAAEQKKRQRDDEAAPAGGHAPAPAPAPQSRPNAPNRILFVENLPDESSQLMLSTLFQQFPGFKEVRMVPSKHGIAFVEFESELESSVAMNGLQHFPIGPEKKPMLISFARK